MAVERPRWGWGRKLSTGRDDEDAGPRQDVALLNDSCFLRAKAHVRIQGIIGMSRMYRQDEGRGGEMDEGSSFSPPFLLY